MTETSEEGQKILINFLGKIAEDGGWWYRLPLRQYENDDNKNKNEASESGPITDRIMPHLGKLFGLTEDAAAVLLEVLQLVKFTGKQTWINHQGWENMCSLHKVDRLVEPKQSRLAGSTRNVWFVRLGTVPLDLTNPNMIWNAFKKHPRSVSVPTSLCDRKTTNFVVTELSSVLCKSQFFNELYQVRDFATSNVITKSIIAGFNKDVQDKTTINDNDDLNSGSEAPNFWSLTEGEVPDAKEFPIANKFGIPTSNRQTVEGLLAELTKVLQSLDGPSDSKMPPNSFVVHNKIGNPTMYIPVPKGNSKSTMQRIGQVANASINWCSDGTEVERSDCAKEVLLVLERKDPDSFLDVANDCGYSTQSSPKMSAEFFTAMSEGMGLKYVQQRMLNQFLAEFYGKRQCVPEYELRKLTSHYISFEHEYLEFPVLDKPGKKKKVLYSWKDLSKVIIHYIENIMEDNPELIEDIQICLGGDHGKAKFTFLALVAIRYPVNSGKKDLIMEFQIGQIDDEEDTMELL